MFQTRSSLVHWLSLPVLLTASLLSRFALRYERLADVMICLAAVALILRAARSKEYLWAATFGAVAVAVSPLLLVAKVFILMGFIYTAAFYTLRVAFRAWPVRAILL